MSKFTDFFSNVGHGISSGLNTLGHGISSIGKPLLSAAGQLAPMAGTMLGGAFGGPAGAALGGSLGGMAGNLFGQMSGGGQQEQGMPSFQGMGQNLGGQAGNYLNQMLPQGMQGMNLGQMGSSLQNQFGSRLNQMLPQGMQGMGLGQRAAGFFGNQLASRLPGGFGGLQNQTLGGLGSLLGGQAGNYFGNRFNPMSMMQTMGRPMSTPSFAYGGHLAHGGLRDMAELLGHHGYEEGGHAY